jgi:Ca2+-binding EF-hand superfamily protein
LVVEYTRSISLFPLYYRPLDQNDDDTTVLLLKVQSKLPPNFDARRVLLSSENQDDTSFLSVKTSTTTGMNVPIILALLINQGLLLAVATVLGAVILLMTQGPSFVGHLSEILHWEGFDATNTSPVGIFDLTPTPRRIVLGIIGSIPLLLNNFLIEKSDQRILANINYSTIAMVMTLFGRRSPPDPTFLPEHLQERTFPTTTWPQVLVASMLLSLVAAFCEEIVFRREVAAVLAESWLGHSNVGLILLVQALLFALGHVQPNASTSRGENAILIGLQLINGLGFGTIYLWSGGDIVPSIVAHALYDFIDFYKTWWDANDQLEYAEKMWKTDLATSEKIQVEHLVREMGLSMNDLPYKRLRRLFYTFDFDKNNALSRSEVRKGISYMAVERAGTPPPTEQVDSIFDQVKSSESDRLSFPDFLNLILQSGGVAAKR